MPDQTGPISQNTNHEWVRSLAVTEHAYGTLWDHWVCSKCFKKEILPVGVSPQDAGLLICNQKQKHRLNP
jgi:hypothetical protein